MIDYLNWLLWIIFSAYFTIGAVIFLVSITALATLIVRDWWQDFESTHTRRKSQ